MHPRYENSNDSSERDGFADHMGRGRGRGPGGGLGRGRRRDRFAGEFGGHRGGPGFDDDRFFGEGAFGPRGRGRGRGGRGRGGDVRAAILLLAAESPSHGYQIITEIAERSGGAWRPSPGSVYPAIQQLEDEGLITIVEQDGRKVIHVTEAGQTAVAELADKPEPWKVDSDAGSEGRRALFETVTSTHLAAKQVAVVGTEAQITAAVAILTETRRQLYALLAQAEG